MTLTFGETDLNYAQSYGVRGYVGLYANTLATRLGTTPNVVNLAIDGETATSFFSNTGRTPPVAGRGDAPLQLENLNYANSTALSQSQVFANTVSAQTRLGNTIAAVTITLGFNELAALAPAANTPALEAAALSQVPAELAAYRANYNNVLSYVRGLAPTASLSLLGYYDPFPANEASPAAPLFDTYGAQLNAIIQQLATQYGATYVNNATPFVGNEAAYTYQGVQPAGSSVSGLYGGLLPIGTRLRANRSRCRGGKRTRADKLGTARGRTGDRSNRSSFCTQAGASPVVIAMKQVGGQFWPACLHLSMLAPRFPIKRQNALETSIHDIGHSLRIGCDNVAAVATVVMLLNW